MARVSRSGDWSCGCSISADSAGLSVSELKAEITVLMAIVTANCL